ncbi:NTP transferase domain-containing protein [Bacillus sp. FJAT-49711]|uniref:nucleotidyltransferase family protein n=1 Tax=Bacillus sp. FJAT-49711 TaxID=2833585 RepID=UPI001BC947F9|nr:nucleotidyltransferase family protein [Bacillus sp. FJAT-49711]MBS4219746.1 NTP transferase domain-containing protein [Bacillus sp. FJAT-49711]
MKIAGIYLAAGKSSRMGKNKLALPVGNTLLGTMALKTALQSSLEKVYIITNSLEDLSWLESLIEHEKVSIIACPSAHLGQAESIKCGIRSAQTEEMDAIMVLLADQPYISIKIIEDIIRQLKNNPALQFVAASNQNIIKPPVLFSASMYPALLNLQGDHGAKTLLRGKNKGIGEVLTFSSRKAFLDIDTVDDYNELIKN